ncbi:MAG: SDR family oxidoreductase [Bacteroidales bacterium]|jgi:NAD(P)-dependent dehydrogenase (short-subunit alcohol dehydrogenase family)
MNPFNLDGRNILITGASSGIGRQCAINCSLMGANVILTGRDEKRLIEVSSLLSVGNHHYHVFDLTNYSEIESLVNKAVRITGKISGFIHSAGIELPVPINLLKPEHFNLLFAINVISGFEFAKIISKRKYISESGGSFVFIASIMGLLGNSALSAYSASKGAIISGVRSLAIELAEKKIRVNAVSPAQIMNTKMSNNKFSMLSAEEIDKIKKEHPLGFGTAEDVANGCVFLLSEASKWVTGTNLIIDGGYSAK